MKLEYDVIVVGGGHAGCEAAVASANMGCSTLLITMDMTKFGNMSCNPAMGGVAKGQILREIDALGGYSGIVTDKTTIHFRMLNASKGPAMWSPRAQCDRSLFSLVWREMLEKIACLDFWQDSVTSLLIENNELKGVITKAGITFNAKAVILTIGTFENGKIHIGRVNFSGGRIGELSSLGISDQLKTLGFEVGRMKTGTPARLDGRSINFDDLERQYSDETGHFSFLPDVKPLQFRRPCYITHTNEKVHRILERGFKDSPLYAGIIQGIGPRYCPSIEDKIVTFHSKTSHQLFLEPEGVDTVEFYLNGFSSSLPWDIQWDALRHIQGFEKVKIFRPGYAIEYDYYPPTQLNHTLETKILPFLYFAGQINGTTGYEEAAAQGLMAGINASLRVKSKTPFVLMRDEAYIGVLIDDLITKGVDEPYRMFTSRAEYRILLRQDNADERLTERSYNIGLATEERFIAFKQKSEKTKNLISYLKTHSIDTNVANEILLSKQSASVQQKQKLADLLSRPEIVISDFKDHILIEHLDEEIANAAELTIKYAGYIEREKKLAEKVKRLEEIIIPDNFNFSDLNSLTIEARQKLKRIKPKTIGQASRIPGISPADINVMLIRFGR